MGKQKGKFFRRLTGNRPDRLTKGQVYELHTDSYPPYVIDNNGNQFSLATSSHHWQKLSIEPVKAPPEKAVPKTVTKYSIEDNSFDFDSIEKVLEYLIDEEEIEIGDTRIVSKAEESICTIDDLVPHSILSVLVNHSHANYAAFSCSLWARSMTDIQKAELQTMVSSVIHRWAKNNRLTPTFNKFEDIEHMRIRLDNDNPIQYRVTPA